MEAELQILAQLRDTNPTSSLSFEWGNKEKLKSSRRIKVDDEGHIFDLYVVY
jgi:hypothetical protein